MPTYQSSENQKRKPSGYSGIRSEARPSFSPQQIRAIKQSPKGKLPNFILKSYSDANVKASIGGRIGNVGGTVGIDRKTNKPFGSVNYKGKVKAKFGPQGY